MIHQVSVGNYYHLEYALLPNRNMHIFVHKWNWVQIPESQWRRKLSCWKSLVTLTLQFSRESQIIWVMGPNYINRLHILLYATPIYIFISFFCALASLGSADVVITCRFCITVDYYYLVCCGVLFVMMIHNFFKMLALLMLVQLLLCISLPKLGTLYCIWLLDFWRLHDLLAYMLEGFFP